MTDQGDELTLTNLQVNPLKSQIGSTSIEGKTFGNVLNSNERRHNDKK